MQEPILQQNVDLFLDQLQKKAAHGVAVDLRLWYNYATFDTVGDLAFGESFGCLASSTYHEWVSFVVEYFYMATLLQVVHRFRPLNRLLAALIPSSLKEKRERHRKSTLEKIMHRLERGADRPDFVQPLLAAKETSAISDTELEQMAGLLIVAGSETTATALASVTFLLLQNPAALTELVQELRSQFKRESDIDISSINQLHYLQAVIQEGLRLFPPITNGFPRQSFPEGAVVDGQFVPGNVSLPSTLKGP